MNEPTYACPACGDPDQLAERTILNGLVRGTATHTDSGPEFTGADETQIDWDNPGSKGLACVGRGWTSQSPIALGAVTELATDPTMITEVAFRQAVVDHLTNRGTTAQIYHSGGGIFGVQVTVGHLTWFSTLSSEGRAWLDFDIETVNGFLASIELQVRPYDHPPRIDHTTPGHAAAVAAEITRVIESTTSNRDH